MVSVAVSSSSSARLTMEVEALAAEALTEALTRSALGTIEEEALGAMEEETARFFIETELAEATGTEEALGAIEEEATRRCFL